jgi:hypothetical protein
MGSSGGGSSSGAISYPLYMTQYHEAWLQEVQADVHLITKNGNNRNPFYNVNCFEPTPFLEAISTQATKDLLRMEAFYPGVLFGTIHNATVARVQVSPPYTLAKTGLDTLTTEINEITPTTNWIGAVDLAAAEINEDTDYDAIILALQDFKDALTAFNVPGTWTSDAAVVKAGIDLIESDENYNDDAMAYAKVLEDNIVNNILPKFKGGMRDVNAAMSSAFVVGESIIWGMMDRDVAKYLAGLKEKNIGFKYELFKSGLDQLIKMHELELGTHGIEVAHKLALFTKKWEINVSNVNEIIKFINSKIEHLKNKCAIANQLFGVYTDTVDKNNMEVINNEFKYLDEYRKSVNLLVDIDKITMVAYKEKITEQAALRESEWLWNLKLYQYYGNLLASIGSGTAINPPSEANKTKTAIGTMVSGAGIGGMIASGTAVGGPLGAGIGAVLGLGLGLLG